MSFLVNVTPPSAPGEEPTGGQGGLPLDPRPIPLLKPREDLFAEELGVTCLVTTRGDRRWCHESCYANFDRQSWPTKELVVVESGAAAPSPFWLKTQAADSRVRYEHEPGRLSVGGARNRGGKVAKGQVIAQFCDSDSYGETYVERMLSAFALDRDKDDEWEMSKDYHQLTQEHKEIRVFNRMTTARLACLSSFVAYVGGDLRVWDPNHRPKDERSGLSELWDTQERLAEWWGQGCTFRLRC